MKKNRKSFRETAGAVSAIIGLMLVICTADGCAQELPLRMVGIALFGIGAYAARMFNFQTEKQTGKGGAE